METLKYLVFLHCVTVLDSRTEYCDSIGLRCKSCIGCSQMMCVGLNTSSIYKNHCCFRDSKDKMEQSCKSLCFPDEEAQLEKIQIMSMEIEDKDKKLNMMNRELEDKDTQIQMMSMEIEDKDKKLEAKNNEIKELKENLERKEFNETVVRDIPVCNESVTTDKNEPMTRATAGCNGADEVLCLLAIVSLVTICILLLSVLIYYYYKRLKTTSKEKQNYTAVYRDDAEPVLTKFTEIDMGSYSPSTKPLRQRTGPEPQRFDYVPQRTKPVLQRSQSEPQGTEPVDTIPSWPVGECFSADKFLSAGRPSFHRSKSRE